MFNPKLYLEKITQCSDDKSSMEHLYLYVPCIYKVGDRGNNRVQSTCMILTRSCALECIVLSYIIYSFLIFRIYFLI